MNRLGGQAAQQGLTVFSIPCQQITDLRLHRWLIVKYGQIVTDPVGCPQVPLDVSVKARVFKILQCLMHAGHGCANLLHQRDRQFVVIKGGTRQHCDLPDKTWVAMLITQLSVGLPCLGWHNSGYWDPRHIRQTAHHRDLIIKLSRFTARTHHLDNPAHAKGIDESEIQVMFAVQHLQCRVPTPSCFNALSPKLHQI